MPLTRVIRRPDVHILAIPAQEVIRTALAGEVDVPDFLRGRTYAVAKNRATLVIESEDAREKDLSASIRDIIVYEHHEISVYSPEAYAARFRPAES